MNKHENKMRQLLDSGKGTVATRIHSTWPTTVEALAATGKYDYVQFLAEYAPFNQVDLENFARTTEYCDLGSMIKVDYMNRGYVAQKALASGIQSVLFADHHTAEEVEATIKMIRPECPQYGAGQFGFAFRRWVGYRPLSPQLDFAKMASSVVTMFMIEKKEAVDRIDEICAVPGVDMLQFGPYDYAMSCGFNAADDPQRVRAAEEKIIKAAEKYGVQVCAELMDVKEAPYYLDLGIKHFNVGIELLILENFWKTQGQDLLEMMDKAGIDVNEK